MISISNPEMLRQALARLTPGIVKAQEDLTPPVAKRIYLPQAHRKAFDWDSTIVVGMRGVGKSLWTAALNDATLRSLIRREWKMDIYESMHVRVAFGLDESDTLFPSGETLARLVKSFEPRHIWRAVLLDKIREVNGLNLSWHDWSERTGWVRDNPEEANRLIHECDNYLISKESRLLLVFDTLERLSPSGDWEQSRRLLQGALQLALSLRSTRSLRVKLFLRPDMYDDPVPWEFAESSKLKQSRSDLTWSPVELYTLLLQLLVNDDECGEEIRNILELQPELTNRPEGGVTFKPERLPESIIRPRVEAIMGKYMGLNARRGMTYTWIPNHLTDAKGRVSPRTFLTALNKAAEETSKEFNQHTIAVHYRAINAGVAEASRIRVDEIQEDYPWVRPLIEAIKQITVPCFPEELTNRWKEADIERMKGERKLPPRRFTTDPIRQGDPSALLDDLEDLAVISRAEGGRINMPDIFRVAAGIKRKGGVPPAR